MNITGRSKLVEAAVLERFPQKMMMPVPAEFAEESDIFIEQSQKRTPKTRGKKVNP